MHRHSRTYVALADGRMPALRGAQADSARGAIVGYRVQSFRGIMGSRSVPSRGARRGTLVDHAHMSTGVPEFCSLSETLSEISEYRDQRDGPSGDLRAWTGRALVLYSV